MGIRPSLVACLLLWVIPLGAQTVINGNTVLQSGLTTGSAPTGQVLWNSGGGVGGLAGFTWNPLNDATGHPIGGFLNGNANTTLQVNYLAAPGGVGVGRNVGYTVNIMTPTGGGGPAAGYLACLGADGAAHSCGGTSPTWNGIAGSTGTDASGTSVVVVTVAGMASCAFDNATTMGDFVTVSGSGGCHDAGAARPSGGLLVGQVKGNSTGPGTNGVVALYGPGMIAGGTGGGGGGGGSGTPGGSSPQLQFNNLGVFGGTTGVTYDGANGIAVAGKIAVGGAMPANRVTAGPQSPVPVSWTFDWTTPQTAQNSLSSLSSPIAATFGTVNNMANAATYVASNGGNVTNGLNAWIAQQTAAGNKGQLWIDPTVGPGYPTSAMVANTAVLDARGNSVMDWMGTFGQVPQGMAVYQAFRTPDAGAPSYVSPWTVTGDFEQGGIYNFLGSYSGTTYGTKSWHQAQECYSMHRTGAQKACLVLWETSLVGGETIGYNNIMTNYGGYLTAGEEPDEGMRFQMQMGNSSTPSCTSTSTPPCSTSPFVIPTTTNPLLFVSTMTAGTVNSGAGTIAYSGAANGNLIGESRVILDVTKSVSSTVTGISSSVPGPANWTVVSGWAGTPLTSLMSSWGISGNAYFDSLPSTVCGGSTGGLCAYSGTSFKANNIPVTTQVCATFASFQQDPGYPYTETVPVTAVLTDTSFAFNPITVGTAFNTGWWGPAGSQTVVLSPCVMPQSVNTIPVSPSTGTITACFTSAYTPSSSSRCDTSAIQSGDALAQVMAYNQTSTLLYGWIGRAIGPNGQPMIDLQQTGSAGAPGNGIGIAISGGVKGPAFDTQYHNDPSGSPYFFAQSGAAPQANFPDYYRAYNAGARFAIDGDVMTGVSGISYTRCLDPVNGVLGFFCGSSLSGGLQVGKFSFDKNGNLTAAGSLSTGSGGFGPYFNAAIHSEETGTGTYWGQVGQVQSVTANAGTDCFGRNTMAQVITQSWTGSNYGGIAQTTAQNSLLGTTYQASTTSPNFIGVCMYAATAGTTTVVVGLTNSLPTPTNCYTSNNFVLTATPQFYVFSCTPSTSGTNTALYVRVVSSAATVYVGDVFYQPGVSAQQNYVLTTTAAISGTGCVSAGTVCGQSAGPVALPNGSTAITQAVGDATTSIATDAFVGTQTLSTFFDDFIRFAGVTPIGIGTPTGGLCATSSVGVNANHNGVFAVGSGTAASTGEACYMNTLGGLNVAPAWTYETDVYLQSLPGTNAETFQSGMANAVNVNPWTTGIAFEVSSANAVPNDWYCEYGTTLTDSTVAATASAWHKLTIKSDGTNAHWYIDGTEATACVTAISGLPSTVQALVWSSYTTTTTSATQYVDYVLFQRQVTR